MPKILYVEDDEAIRRSYASLLKQAGFDVLAAEDKATALQMFSASKPDLALLDISLGDDTEAGYDLCNELRKRSESLPIIFLTLLDSEADKISGMRLGADDYITKDISIDYLLVRIKALLKRFNTISKQAVESKNIVERGDLTINTDNFSVAWKNKPIDLTLTHFWIVYALANHVGHVRTLDQLMEAASIRILPNTFQTHITNIRRRFQSVDEGFSAIKTERGIGYRWVETKE